MLDKKAYKLLDLFYKKDRLTLNRGHDVDLC